MVFNPYNRCKSMPTRRRIREHSLPPITRTTTHVTAKSTRRLTHRELFEDDTQRTIAQFVQQHAQGATFEERLRTLANAIRAFTVVSVPFANIQDKWANRRAAETLRQKTLLVNRIEDAPPEIAVSGCMDGTIAFLAAARKLSELEGKHAKFFLVRQHIHSYVRARFESINIFIDPTRKEPIKRVNEQRVRKLQRKGEYAEGTGPRSINLFTVADFNKYDPERKRAVQRLQR